MAGVGQLLVDRPRAMRAAHAPPRSPRTPLVGVGHEREGQVVDVRGDRMDQPERVGVAIGQHHPSERGREVAQCIIHGRRHSQSPNAVRETGQLVDSRDQGIAAVVLLAASRELDDVTGRYFDGQVESVANDQVDDMAARERLWALSEQLVGLPITQ